MGIRNGKEYLQKLDNETREIWIDDEKITRGLSQHPSFHRVALSMADLYDMQNDPKLIDEMTYISPTTGNRVGMSFLEPKTIEDLSKKRIMMKHWADRVGGMLGRTPDFLNCDLMALASAAELFGKKDPKYAANIRNYYEYIRENDLLLTHTIISPQVNRSISASEQTDPFITARVADKNEKGVVIRGARLLATFPLADELLVLPSVTLKLSQTEAPYAFAFGISVETPGLKFICRESFAKDSIFDHPLASRYDEQDAVVVFDNVLVPWDRIFLLEDIEAVISFHSATDAVAHHTHQVLVRRIAKTEFILGLVFLIADTIGIDQFPHVHEKVVKVIITLDIMKALLIACESSAKLNQWGIMTPDAGFLETSRNIYSKIYSEIREIIQLLGAGGLMALPTEKMMNSPIRKDIDKYYQAKNANAEERIKLFHLCWDIAGSSFGSRQELYERFFSGDPVRMASAFYNRYEKEPFKKLVKDFLNRKI